MSMNWRIAASSVVGTSHLKTGARCQDSHHARIVRVGNQEFFIGLVSDGAGSATLSDIGSAKACEIFSEVIEQHLLASGGTPTLQHAQDWLSTVQVNLQAIASSEGRQVRDYACTILGAIIGADWSTFFQIGDGAIVISVSGEDDEWCWVFWPQHGEFANTTNFLTDERAVDCMEFVTQTGYVSEIAMFTDGLENLLLQKSDRSVFSPWFNQMLPAVRALEKTGADAPLSQKLSDYLHSDTVCARSDDDKTLILASQRSTRRA